MISEGSGMPDEFSHNERNDAGVAAGIDDMGYELNRQVRGSFHS